MFPQRHLVVTSVLYLDLISLIQCVDIHLLLAMVNAIVRYVSLNLYLYLMV